MELHYYIMLNGKRVGPLHASEVRGRINAGEVHAQTPIWHDGLDAWKPCGEVLKDVPERGIWFAVIGREKIGPLTEDAFRRAVMIGEIKRETKVWKQGMPKWRSWGNYSKEQGIVITTLDPKTLEGLLAPDTGGGSVLGPDAFSFGLDDPKNAPPKYSANSASRSISKKSGGGFLSRLAEKFKKPGK